MSVHLAKPEHEATYQELIALVTRHAIGLTAAEILAIGANMVGKLVAMQDQKTMTPSMAMEIVARNVQVGNQQVLDELAKSVGRS